MKLEPHRIGGERSARQSRPLDRAFALLDPLLARPALVVESSDALGLAAHVRHDEAEPLACCCAPASAGTTRPTRVALTAISESRRPRRNSVRYPVNAGLYQSAERLTL